MPMKRVVAQATPVDVVSIDQLDDNKLYGVQHKKRSNKKYKVHVRADGGLVELCGFLNSTGHLNEDDGFANLAGVFNYCQSKGHQMYQFDNAAEFAAWLAR